MTPKMSDPEQQFLRSFLSCSRNYLEFGASGSTVLACSLVRKSVTAVDSSAACLEDVRIHCSQQANGLTPYLVQIDIGETVEWGYPKNGKTQDSWPNYYTKIWEHEIAWQSDLFLIDGRFRVACFVQALLHAGADAIILFHDFINRPIYHVVRQFAIEFAREGSLSAFRPRAGFDRAAALGCLNAHKYITD